MLIAMPPSGHCQSCEVHFCAQSSHLALLVSIHHGNMLVTHGAIVGPLQHNKGNQQDPIFQAHALIAHQLYNSLTTPLKMEGLEWCFMAITKRI